MSQVHQCGFLTSEVLFELERVREHARNQNADATGSHLAVVEKELRNMALFCELGDQSNEVEHLSNIKSHLGAKNWGAVQAEALELEKEIVVKQARNYNDGNDPLDVIPSRMWDALK